MNWASGKFYKTRGGEVTAQIVRINTAFKEYQWILAHLFKDGQYFAVQTYGPDGMITTQPGDFDLMEEVDV